MKIYNQKDIKELLGNELKAEWNGQVYDGFDKVHFDEHKQSPYPLVVEQFCGGRSLETSISVDISDFIFHIYIDEPEILGSGSNMKMVADLSDKWIDLLLKNHGKNYAKKVLNYHTKKMDALTKYIDTEVEEFRKATMEKLAPEYDKLAILYLKADSILREEELKNIWQYDEPTK